jgi:predicted nuclease of predicted toxin-antitoxin system
MRILVDENIPLMTVARLRELGHDVRDVRGTPDQGMEDPDLWSAAMADRRALITTDRGFTEYRAVPHYGIVIVRLRQPNRRRIHQAVMVAIERFRKGNGPVCAWSCEIPRSACLAAVAWLRGRELFASRRATRLPTTTAGCSPE